jgi:membrane protein
MPDVPARPGFLSRPPELSGSALYRAFRPTLAYWMETEVHVYAFSIAVNVLLSIFPFLIVILSLSRAVLGWNGAAAAVGIVLNDYFPGDPSDHATMAGFISDNLRWALGSRHTLQIVSILLLLFTANGIFEPLEVAFNRAWGAAKNRTFVRNQLVSLGLILLCGSLALASTALTGVNAERLGESSLLSRAIEVAVFKMAAVPVSILILFLIYWLLPNRKIVWRDVLPPAILVGLGLEVLKYINLLTFPLWYRKLHAEYGPFTYSVTIVMWSFLGAMLILAGAEWAARRARAAEKQAGPG